MQFKNATLIYKTVATCRRVMHDSMQYDPIQGHGHEPLKVGKSAIFKRYLAHLSGADK